MIKLLDMQRSYWKQRFTQRIVQYGDENTKFFHAMATERYRRDVICQISDSSRHSVSDHQGKSALFFQEFKARLGTSVDIDMQFDLQNIVDHHDDLEELCLPFTKDEINNIILEFPNEKASGPDRFTGLFFKKAWHHIRADFFTLFNDFFSWYSRP